MKAKLFHTTAIAVLVACLLAPCLHAATPLDESFAALAKFKDGESHIAVIAVEKAVYLASNDAKARAAMASRLIALIESKSATIAAKNISCRLLPLVGDKRAVKPLVALMGDPKTAGPARGALQRLALPEAAKAIRDAMAGAKGAVKVGLINSIGARRDAEATGALKALLTDKDAEIAGAAMAALGEIGSTDAVAALTDKKLKPSPELLDALLQCAEIRIADKDAKSASPIYQRLISAGHNDNWKWAGLTGLAKCSPADTLAPLLAVLDSPDVRQHSRALSLIATLPGAKVTEAMTARLDKGAGGLQVLLLGALAQRGDEAAADAVAGFLSDKDAAVRSAAIEATGHLGGARHIPALVAIAADSKDSSAIRAWVSIVRLPGKDVDAALIAGMSKGKPAVRAELIGAAAERGAKGAIPAMLSSATDPEAVVRQAACKGLTDLAGRKELPKLVALLASASTDADREVLGQSVLATGRRIEDNAAVSKAILVGLKKSDGEKSIPLLHVVSHFGGTDALATVVARIDSKNATVSEAALRSLTNWPDAEACPPLLKIVRTTKDNKHRTLAMRRYLRLAPASKDPAAALEQIRKLVKTAADKRLMLSTAAGAAASEASLSMAVSMLGDSQVKREAVHAAVAIARKLATQSPKAVLAACEKVRQTNPPKGVLTKIDAVERLAKQKLQSAAPAAKKAAAGSPAPKLQALMPSPKDPDKTNVLIVTGVDYPGHKWKKTTPVLAEILAKDKRMEVQVVTDPHQLSSPKLHKYDVLVVHFMDWKVPSPGPEARANFKKFVSAGGGLVFVHFACGAWQDWDEFGKIAGRAWNPKMRGHDPHRTFTVEIAKPDHPITKGLEKFTTIDELYTCLDGKTPIEVLAHARSKVDKKLYAMGFVLQFGKGRVFHSPLGHDVRAFKAPGVGELFRRGTAWAAKIPPVPAGK